MEPPIRTGRLAKVNDGTAGAPEGGVTFRARPSGVFSYAIATKGNVEVDGTTLRVVPTEGTESLTDPDSPSDSYTDQPTDLAPQDVPVVGVRELALPRRRVRRRRVPPVDMTGVRQWVTANRLQVAVTVMLAAAPRCGHVVERKASGSWQQATRQDGRSAALRVESVRFVYQSELPLAIGLAEAQVRRDALAGPRGRTDAEVVGELAAADQLVGPAPSRPPSRPPTGWRRATPT